MSTYIYTCKGCGQPVQIQYANCPHCQTPRPPVEEIARQLTTGGSSEREKSNRKSVLLLISAILGVAYAIYSIVYWAGAAASTSGWEAVGAGIATALVMPHLICAVLAAIFNVLGWAMSSRGLALTGAILYAVAAALFPMYAFFVLVQVILSFIGFAKLKK